MQSIEEGAMTRVEYAILRQIARDEMMEHNINARLANERSGYGADGWERF